MLILEVHTVENVSLSPLGTRSVITSKRFTAERAEMASIRIRYEPDLGLVHLYLGEGHTVIPISQVAWMIPAPYDDSGRPALTVAELKQIASKKASQAKDAAARTTGRGRLRTK